MKNSKPRKPHFEGDACARVKKTGWALRYASDELRSDREVVMEAVQKRSEALEYASPELQNDPEIRKAAGRP